MTTAIVGRTGSGKTYAAKGIVEGFLDAGERVCVIDPTGAWWGLRAPGAGDAFDVIIFGGDHADVPIDASAGERLADLIVSGAVRQCVVDVSTMLGGRRTHFLSDLFERLFASNRGPLNLIMDEADVMAPQHPMPEQRRLQGAVNQIVRRGRIKGFRPMMITQRPAVLDKSVLSQIDTLIAMRLTSPQDRKAIEAWVKGSADEDQAKPVLESLASLSLGEGWRWAPADDALERVSFPAIRSYDSSRTPEHGEQEVGVVAPPAGLEEILRALAPPVEIKPTPGKRTSRQVDDSRVASTAGAEPPAEHAVTQAAALEAVAAAEKRGYDRGFTEGRAFAATVIDDALRSMKIVLAQASDGIAAAVTEMKREQPIAQVTGRERRRAPDPDMIPFPPIEPKPVVKRAQAAQGNMKGAARKMLAVLDTNPPVRRSWTQIATLAGLKARGGHFNAGKKALLDGGLAVEDGGLIRIARPSADARPDSVDPSALVETWASALSGAAPKILRLLHDAPWLVSRAEIASQLSVQPRGGHWNAAWKELKDNEIVTVDGDAVSLSPLFRRSA